MANPEKYLQAEFSSQYSHLVSNYNNSVVMEKLQELNEFEWNDAFSEDLLEQTGLSVQAREEVTLASKVKYTGEWYGSMRHGRGT